MKERVFLPRTASFLVACFALVAISIPASSLLSPAAATGEERSQPSAKSGTALDKAKPHGDVSESSITKSRDSYGRLPISFEINRGQTDKKVKFLARGQGYGMFLTTRGVVLSLYRPFSEGTDFRAQSAVLQLKLKGSNSSPRIFGVDELPGKVNYFIGRQRSKWRSNVRTYSKVRYANVYRGIDLVYYGNQQQLEYDFVIAAGADPNRIKLSFKGAEDIRIDENGNLVLKTSAGDVIQQKPVAYQEIDGKRHQVSARYDLKGDEVSFKLGAYDRTKALIIDPVLAYSTFLGGSSIDTGLGIAVDALGNAYLTGETLSADFPTIMGGLQTGNGGIDIADAFVVKLNPTGTAMVYSTYLGGSENEIPNAIKIDELGHAYITGTTFSDNFPTTAGAFQQTKSGRNDVFVSKLNPSGSALIYSTLIGGDNTDTAFSIALRTDGRAYVVGRTTSTSFQSFSLNRHGSTAYKSADGAVNWSASGTGLTASSVVGFGLDPSNSNVIYAATNIGVFKSNNAGSFPLRPVTAGGDRQEVLGPCGRLIEDELSKMRKVWPFRG